MNHRTGDPVSIPQGKGSLREDLVRRLNNVALDIEMYREGLDIDEHVALDFAQRCDVICGLLKRDKEPPSPFAQFVDPALFWAAVAQGWSLQTKVDNLLHVVVLGPTGVPYVRTDDFDSPFLAKPKMSSQYPIIGIWVVRDVNGVEGSPYWDEFAGNSEYTVVRLVDGGVGIVSTDYERSGPGRHRVRRYFKDEKRGESVEGPLNATASTTWRTYENGQGDAYGRLLKKAKARVRCPGHEIA